MTDAPTSIDVDRRHFITTEKSGVVDLSATIGAFKILYEPWTNTWTGFKNGEHYERDIRRPPGVYLPEKIVRGGTIVQTDAAVLRAAAEQLTKVARAAADDGWHVYGAGTDHDNSASVYADYEATPHTTQEPPKRTNAHRYLGNTPFETCVVMEITLKWWEHAENEPAMPPPDLHPDADPADVDVDTDTDTDQED